MKGVKAFWLSGIILLAGIHSCNLDYFDFDKLSTEVELTPSVAAPLAYGEFSIGDLVAAFDSTGIVGTDSSGLLLISYRDTAYSVEASALIDFPDKVYDETYIDSDITGSADWGSSAPGDTVRFYKLKEINYTPDGGERLDSIILNAGDLVMDVTSSFHHAGYLVISSDYILDPEGNKYVDTIKISSADGSFAFNDNYSMADYSLHFLGKGNDSIYLPVDYELFLINSGAGIGPGEECFITMSFEQMDFRNVYGLIGQKEVLNEHIDLTIDFYDVVADLANIYFYDPQMNIYALNSYGVPVELELRDVFAYSEAHGTTTQLTFTDGGIFSIDAPDIEAIGTTVESVFMVNRSTSNIDEFLASSPNQVYFDMVANTIETTTENFLTDSSYLTLIVEVEMPMWLRSDGYTIRDTIEEINLEETLGGDLSFIEEARLKLNTVNEWPLEVEIQVYFHDQDMNLIDSLFADPLPVLAASNVNGDGELLTPTAMQNLVVYSGSDLMNLKDARFIVFKAHAITSDDGTSYVKLLSDYKVKYDLSLQADFRLTNDSFSSPQ
ncbi:MAG: hypothetical protein ACOYXB_15410 [Bacteroidota bacterium]